MALVAEAQQHVEEPDEPEGTVEKPRKKQRHVSPAAEKAKRAAVLFFYTQLLEPPEEEWDGKHGTVLEIRKRMGLPPGQKHTRMIRRALSAIAAGEGERGRGRGYEGSVPKLTMQEVLIAFHALLRPHPASPTVIHHQSAAPALQRPARTRAAPRRPLRRALASRARADRAPAPRARSKCSVCARASRP